MTPLLIERELTREKAREAIIQTLERFAGLFDKLSRDSRFIVFDERFTRIHWRIENELFIARASQFFNGDEYQRLGNEGIREFLLKLKGLSEKFCLKVVIPQDVEVIETEIENLDYSEKIRRAIEYSNVIDEIIEEIGDINTLVAQMVIVSGILIGLAATGYGAAAEALGFVILAAGAAMSGTQLLAGVIELVKFFTTVDDAKTEDDLKVCGKIFGDAVAKIGVDGLFFFLSMFGLKKASAKLTTRTVIDNGLNSKKWSGKQIEERELVIEEEGIHPSKSYDANAKPRGKPTPISEKMDSATKRSLFRENEAAEIFAKNGYDIEQNPVVEGTSRNPDYKIEGKIFDCYAPAENTKPRNIASTIEEKVIKKGQTERVVLNLNDWKGDVEILIKQLNDYPIDGLKEVLIVQNGKIQSIYP